MNNTALTTEMRTELAKSWCYAVAEEHRGAVDIVLWGFQMKQPDTFYRAVSKQYPKHRIYIIPGNSGGSQ